MRIPTFDIESVNWVNPIAVGFFDGHNYQEFIRESEEDDVIWRFLSYLGENHGGAKLYAHCAARFDNKFILASLCKHGEIATPEAGLIRLKWKETDITFEDSYPMMPMSLAKANKMFGVEEKGEWEHGAKPWEMGDKLPVFKAYLKTDCVSLSHGLGKLCDMLGETFAVTPSVSLPTTAAKVFDKHFFKLRDVDPNEGFEEFIREAVYGGRNEVYRRYGERINHYDARSMYVSCYDVPVPVGRMRWVKGDLDRGTIAEAAVKVPTDWYVGPLPFKMDGRLTFPVGEFTGWWDTRELRFAAELGVDVDIKRQLYCEEEPILERFGREVGKLRGGATDRFWKKFGLTLSGKFGQSRWRDKVVHFTEMGDEAGYSPLDSEEEYFVTKVYLGGKSPYIRPLISMRIRSEARIRHLKMLLEAKVLGDVFYCDTDSIFTTASLPTGEGIGDMALIERAERGYFVRQKLYATVVEGRLKQRSAGYVDLKLSEDNFKHLLNGGKLETDFKPLPSYRTIIREGELVLPTDGRPLMGAPESDNRVPEGEDSRPIVL